MIQNFDKHKLMSSYTIMNSDLTVLIHTKSHQLPFQECSSHHAQNPWCHSWPCQPPIWNGISTCPSIQQVSWHKHLLNVTLLLPSSTTPLVAPVSITSVFLYSWWKPQCCCNLMFFSIFSRLSTLCSSLQTWVKRCCSFFPI